MGISFSRKKKFIVATILISLATTFLFAELIIRIYHFSCGRERFIWIPDDYLGYIHAGNNRFTFRYTEDKEIAVKHKINSLGLPGEETPASKPADTFRVIVLGDSYTEALQVAADKNFCELLEGLLNGSPEKKYKTIEVLNAGVSGYSPLNHYLYFQRELARLAPDTVIVQLFANDVFEDHSAKAKSFLDKQGLPLKTDRYFAPEYLEDQQKWRARFHPDPWTYRLKKSLLNHSRFLEYLYVKIFNFKKASPTHQKMIRMDEYGTGYQFFILDPRHKLMHDEAFIRQTWGDTQRYLLALKEAVEHHQGRFVMFYVPLEGQLDLEHYGDHMRMYTTTRVGDYFNGLLREFAQKNNILFLDLLPKFERHKREGLYLSKDGHLTVKGHQLVAEALFDHLRQHHLVP